MCQRIISRFYDICQFISYSAVAIVLITLFLTNRNYNAVEYTVETDYTKWATRTPAISICTLVDTRFIANRLKMILKGAPVTPQNISFFASILTPASLSGSNFQELPKELSTYKLSELSNLLTSPCESELLDCSLNGIKFSCCQHFQRIPSAKHICYSLNSDQTRLPDAIQPNFYVSISRPNATLEVRSARSIFISIHDNKALPPHGQNFHVEKSQHGEMDYKFQETLIENSAKELTMQQRKCYFDEERVLKGYKSYSKSACTLKCLADNQNRVCACRHPAIPGDGRECNPGEYNCLLTNFSSPRAKNNKRKCGCKRICNELNIQTVFTSGKRKENDKSATIVIRLVKTPTERFIMRAKTNLLETIVGVACLSRLITTASLTDVVRATWTLLSMYFSPVFKVIKATGYMRGK